MQRQNTKKRSDLFTEGQILHKNETTNYWITSTYRVWVASEVWCMNDWLVAFIRRIDLSLPTADEAWRADGSWEGNLYSLCPTAPFHRTLGREERKGKTDLFHSGGVWTRESPVKKEDSFSPVDISRIMHEKGSACGGMNDDDAKTSSSSSLHTWGVDDCCRRQDSMAFWKRSSSPSDISFTSALLMRKTGAHKKMGERGIWRCNGTLIIFASGKHSL